MEFNRVGATWVVPDGVDSFSEFGPYVEWSWFAFRPTSGIWRVDAHHKVPRWSWAMWPPSMGSQMDFSRVGATWIVPK